MASKILLYVPHEADRPQRERPAGGAERGVRAPDRLSDRPARALQRPQAGRLHLRLHSGK